MKCKISYVAWIFLITFSNLIATMEVYDYLQVEELIEKNNNAVEERLYQDWNTNDIIMNYQNDFQLANSGKLIFKADVNKSQTIIQKKESEPIRLFAKYQTDQGSLGFGNYYPAFGLGNIYKQYSNKNFEQKTFSTSQLDLSGLFLSYQFKFSEVSFFYSKTDLNTARDSEGNLQVVFYDSEKHSLQQSGLSAKLSFENVSVSLLTAKYKTDGRIGQFDNKKQSYLISSFIKYEQDNYNLSYETNYQFSEFNHFFLAKFTNDLLTTKWVYRQIPAHSLNWLSSGITNKFNANTKIYAGESSFCLGKINFSLGSELKSNKKIKHWRSRSFVKLAKDNKVSYQLQQDVYRDYQASQHEKYTHRFACELFSFTNSDIRFSYTVNNKSSSGMANMYQIHYNLSGILGDVRVNFKVLDNYRNEEIVEDINENILATFYDFSEDMLISLRFKSRDYQNVVFIGSLTQSLYNNKLDSFKIELSYHL